MHNYNSMELRSAAQTAGLDSGEFEALLDFVEWVGFIAPAIALERAHELRAKLESAVSHGGDGWFMRDYQECRLAIETAVRCKHSSGDAFVRLLFTTLLDASPPLELHLSTFERHFPNNIAGIDVVSALQELRASDDWSYVSAFSNTLKHVSLVDHECSVVLGESVAVRFGPFEFKGHSFPACSQNDLVRILSRVGDALARILNLLGDHLANPGFEQNAAR